MDTRTAVHTLTRCIAPYSKDDTLTQCSLSYGTPQHTTQHNTTPHHTALYTNHTAHNTALHFTTLHCTTHRLHQPHHTTLHTSHTTLHYTPATLHYTPATPPTFSDFLRSGPLRGVEVDSLDELHVGEQGVERHEERVTHFLTGRCLYIIVASVTRNTNTSR